MQRDEQESRDTIFFSLQGDTRGVKENIGTLELMIPSCFWNSCQFQITFRRTRKV